MNKILTAILLLLSSPAIAGSTVQRDAPTTRFYDARGNVTGSATAYGNTTKFYAPDGRLIGSAATNGGRSR
jgi:YD repeat-containing protein